jgi:preprotein translocase subunit YajC
MNEIILIILMGLVLGFFLWREDKKKKEEETSNRLYEAENNITHLNNINYKRKYKRRYK